MSNVNGFDILLNTAKVVVQKKRLILVGTLVPAFIAAAVVFFMTSTYQAEVLINPPRSQGNTSQLGALAAASGMGDIVGSFLNGGNEGLNDCVSLLESSRFASLVIKRFDLETRYKFTKKKKYYQADVLKRFRRNMSYEVTDEDAIHLTMEDESPEKAAEIAGYMVYVLDSLYTDVQRTEIRNRLRYVDERLGETQAETKVLEDSLTAFQNRNNFLVPDVQMKLILENATQTELRLETLKEEMELEASLRGTNSAKYQDMLVEKRLIDKTLKSRLRNTADSNSLLLPTHSLTTLASEYFRLERAYTIRLGVYKYLVQQVETLKLDANKNVQVISVIDPPWVNDKRVSPKRRAVVEVVFILSLIASLLVALVISLWEKHKRENPGTSALVRDLRTRLFKF